MTTLQTSLWRPAGVALGLTVLWVVVAAWRPETTYHLAPVLVAGAPPVALALDAPSSRAVNVFGAAGFGLLIALVATAGLSAAGWLAGPSRLPAGGAAVEAVVFSLVGAALGVVAAFVVRSRAAPEG